MILEKDYALSILGLDLAYTQLDLIREFQSNLSDLSDLLKNETERDFIVSIAERINDITGAYMTLRDPEIIDYNQSLSQQPLVIFTDASYKEGRDTSTFGIVVENIEKEFHLPERIIQKYKIQSENEHHDGLCILTGEIINHSVDAAEIIAIIATVEIFMFLTMYSGQKIVIYTDSLIAKKILSDKRRPPNTRIFSELRKRFNKLIEVNELDIVIKKVKAHAGIEQNELADMVAKERNGII